MTEFELPVHALNMAVELSGVLFLFRTVESRDEKWKIVPALLSLMLLGIIYMPVFPYIKANNDYSAENLFNQIFRTSLNFLAIFGYLYFRKDRTAAICAYLSAFYILLYMVSFNMRQALFFLLFGMNLQTARWQMLFIIAVIQWTIVYAAYRLVDFNGIRKITPTRWVSIVIPITIELYFKWSLIALNENYQRLFDTIFYTLCATLGVVLMVILLERNIAAQEKSAEMALQQMRLQFEMQNANRALRSDTNIRRLYHDMKNHMLALQAMIGDDETRRNASEYLTELCGQLEEYETNIHTGSTIADAILAEKMERARLDNIRFNICVDLAPLNFMHTTDIVTILGNALDNAVEALQMMPEGQDRIVYLKSVTYANMLVLRISNQFCGKLSVKNGMLHTLKSDADMHGIGLKSIEKAVKRYNGNMETQFDNNGNWFRLILMIPVSPNSVKSSAQSA